MTRQDHEQQVTERHLSESYAHEMGLLMNMPEGFEPNATWERLVRALSEQRHNHPSVISGAKLIAAREACQARMAKMLGLDLSALPAKPKPASTDDRIKKHMDSKTALIFEVGRRAFGKPFEDAAVKIGREQFRAGKPVKPFARQQEN